MPVRMVLLVLAGGLGPSISLPAAEQPLGSEKRQDDEPVVLRERSEFDVRSWDTEHGLPGNDVHSILNARDGHIWLGTTRGAAVFNGIHFKALTRNTTPGFPNARISAVLEAPDGSMWVATGNGVARVHKGAVTTLSTRDGLLSRAVTSLALGADGSIWIGTDRGLNRYKDGQIWGYAEREGVTLSAVTALHSTPKGNVWIGTPQGILRVVDDALRAELGSERLKNPTIRAMFEDDTGGLWFATAAEVSRLHNGVVTRFGVQDGINPVLVKCIKQVRAGTVWFGTTDGLYRFDGQRFEVERFTAGAAQDAIWCIEEDREANLWIGTNDGVKRLRRKVFASLVFQDVLTHNIVNSVCEDGAGRIWVGTRGGGLNMLEGPKRVVYRRRDGLLSNHIRALYPARDGGVWVAFTAPGLVRIKDGRVTRFTDPSIFRDRPAFTLFEDSRGTLWMGMRDGTVTFRDGAFERQQKVRELAGNSVRAFAETPDGSIWIGTDAGLVRYRQNEYSLVDHREGMPGKNILSLHVDREGVLWIGTQAGGLVRMEDNVFRACTTKHGFHNDTILGIADDAVGNIWAITGEGVIRVSKLQLDEFVRGARATVDCIIFNKTDGLPAIGTSRLSTPGIWLGADGRLWFATMKSLAVTNPAQVQVNTTPPPVLITGAQIDGVDLPLAQAERLPAGVSDLEFRYVALSYAQPERVRYRYRLKGINSSWIDAGNRQVASFSRLPPGEHELRVQARNEHGVWNEAGATFNFHIAPHFYETRWFLGAVIGLVVSAAYGGYSWRFRLLKRREQELIALVQKRTSHLETEIGERKRVEALYHSLVEVLPVMLYRKDKDGRFTFANEHYCQRVGRRLEDIVDLTEHDLYPHGVAEQHSAADRQVLATGEPLQFEEVEVLPNGERRWFDNLKVPVVEPDHRVVGTQQLTWDITARKRAEEQAEKTHRELIAMSRLAGMADVATNVLHNVGNALNSVNVSATLAADLVQRLKIGQVAKLSALLEQHQANLADFLTAGKGQAMPTYLNMLSEHLTADQAAIVAELGQLRRNVEHIKTIVAAQQSFAKTIGINEPFALRDVIDEALRTAPSAPGNSATVLREFAAHPIVKTDKHKMLQILLNLLQNARQACAESSLPDRQIRVKLSEKDGRAQITVADNGVGIPAENLTRIFSHDFTRKSGHGSGLHGSANAAKELGGTLSAKSAGAGEGAEFVLEVPLERPGTSDRRLPDEFYTLTHTNGAAPRQEALGESPSEVPCNSA